MSRWRWMWVGVTLVAVAVFGFGVTIDWSPEVAPPARPIAADPSPEKSALDVLPVDLIETIPGPATSRLELTDGETIEISCRIVAPSELPARTFECSGP